MTGYIHLQPQDLALAASLVLANALLSAWLQWGLHRRLVLVTVRMVIQLILMGWALTWLFAASSAAYTGLAAVVMVGFSGYEAVSRQERRLAGIWSYGIGASAMCTTALATTILALTTAIRPDPWYDPRYALPLLGMILGNAMSGVALGLNSLSTGLFRQRLAIEGRLLLGQSRQTALRPVVRQALRTALIPIMNTMAATGLVVIPGMMTGQILGGVAPMDAVQYQILILCLVAGGTGLGAAMAVSIAAWRLTDSRHRLRLDRLKP